jgi:DNA polymerase-3 subunit alpha
MNTYFNCHTHTNYSNLRLIDAINKPQDLIDKAIELGLSGIAITDHECLSAHVEAEKYMTKIQSQHPDFKLAFGNEIYLVDERKMGQKYYHFILLAKDAIGHRALRELSSRAWMNSYTDRKLERVPTTKEELKEVVSKFKGHLIATTACIGGELPSTALLYTAARKINDMQNAVLYYKKIESFITYCLDLFGEDFYIECAPGTSAEQVAANQICRRIASVYGIQMVVGTDAHYLTKTERSVHKAYLNSKEGDREVDSFYEFTYLMDYDEVTKYLTYTFDGDRNFAEQVVNNTLEIYNKISSYSLFHKQDIPSVEVKDYPKAAWWGVNNDYADDMKHRFPTLCKLFTSDDIQDRYWVNQCWDKLNELDKGWIHYNETGDDRYLAELEEEARVKSVISEKLETNMFRYPNTLQHYIDLIWDCGSMVGAGRGSSCAALNHYLMGITQLDPIQWELPFFRYLNDERVELGDIDIDLCPSKVGLIISKIAAERSKMFNNDVPDWAKKLFGCTRISTFGTEGTKSAILTACRGYRTDEYPNGIDVD